MYSPHEGYYRNLYWGVMTSEHAEAREVRLVTSYEALAELLQKAINAGELVETDTKRLAEHLVLS
ncbi:MAG: hypothetical protein ACKO4A_01925 [Gammaproteobacteria bacterium]